MKRWQADCLLLLAALIWGSGFIAQKDANLNMGAITFVGARFLLSALAILPLALSEHKRSTQSLTRNDFGILILVGLCLCSGCCFQQMGLVTTTAGTGGFLTALYVIFVPFLVWIMQGKAPSLSVLFACFISLLGAWLLTSQNSISTPWHKGEIEIIISCLLWGISIPLIPVFLHRTHRPFLLSFGQFLITGVIALFIGILCEPLNSDGISKALPAILYAGFIGGSAFTLQIIAQKHTPASEAALIMSLESVFAALFGILLLGERLNFMAIAGCVLILSGVVLVEMRDVFVRYFKNT